MTQSVHPPKPQYMIEATVGQNLDFEDAARYRDTITSAVTN